MRRFLAAGLPDSGRFALTGDDAEHLVRVLRARPGDEVSVFDGRGRERLCRVVAAERREDPVLEVVSAIEPRRPLLDVMLCTAVPRGDRMEWLVEKAAECGASSIVPWAAARSVRERAGDNTLRRWRRAAAEACKQCGRADVPEVTDVVSLAGAVAAAAGRVVVVGRPGAAASLRDVLGGAARSAVFVGPEGGFEPAEDAALDDAGARPYSLGPLVLRIETAAAVSVLAASGAAG